MSPLTKTSEFRLKLYPKDFSKVKEFYETVLKYPLVGGWDKGTSKGAMFDTGAGIIELLTPDKYAPIKGSDVSLMVADVWSLWESLKDHPNIVHKLRSREWGDTDFTISDPEGFEITFFTHTPERPQ